MIPPSTWVRWIAIAVGVVVLIVALIMVSRCGRPDAVKQAEQTTRSNDATADAAAVAINALEGRVAKDGEIDRAVGVAMMEIENATDPDAIRAAVLAGVCDKPEHRDDPACAVR